MFSKFPYIVYLNEAGEGSAGSIGGLPAGFELHRDGNDQAYSVRPVGFCHFRILRDVSRLVGPAAAGPVLGGRSVEGY